MNIVLLGLAYDGKVAYISIQRTAIMVSSRLSHRFANCVRPPPVCLPSRYDAVVLRAKFRCCLASKCLSSHPVTGIQRDSNEQHCAGEDLKITGMVVSVDSVAECVELRFANERNASEADFGDASLEQGWFRWPDDCIRACANVYGLGADYHR